MKRLRRLVVAAALAWAPLAVGLSSLASCAVAPQAVHVLQVQPPMAFRVLGMVSGQGPNIPSAIEHARYLAAEMDGDAIIVGHQHNLGRQWVVTVKVIKYLAPPPPM